MAKQLSSRREYAAVSSVGILLLPEKKVVYSLPPPGVSTKREETTPESSRPSKESAFLRERE